MQKYYISFINHLCPDALGANELQIEWPMWDNCTGKLELLNIAANETSLTQDTFRQAAWEYLRENVEASRQ